MILCNVLFVFFFFSSRRRHTRFDCDWSSDVCSSDLFCRSVHEIHLRPKNVELADYGAVEKGAPLQGKIDERRGEERHRHKRSEERRVGKECRTRWAAEN